jgi:hypothetical protein
MIIPKLLIINLITLLGGQFQANKQDCSLVVEVKSAPQSRSGVNSTEVVVKSGLAPYRYIFLEKSSGKLLSNDYSKNKIEKLKSGKYQCLVIDNAGCSKQVDFDIQ